MPDPPAAQDGKNSPPVDRRTRLKRLQDKDAEPLLPEVSAAGHLITYLLDIGPSLVAGQGSGPITYGEIRAWQELRRIPLTPWESGLLHRLSKEYLNERLDGDPKRAAPWPEGIPSTANHAAQSMRESIRALANS